jgi:hypothetical protein
MPSRFRLTVLACSALLAVAGGASAAPTETVRGLVTQVVGEITVLAGGGRSADTPTPQTPRPLDTLPAGSTLVLDAGERIELLCSTDHLVTLEGPARERLDGALCKRGERQPASTFRGVSPRRGRLVEVGDVLALEMTTRADDTRAVPVLLSPRNTAVLDPSPELVWTATPGAIEYRVRVTGAPPIGQQTLTVEPPEAGCGAARDDWPGVEVCHVPWSDLGGSSGIPTAGVYVDVGSRFALGAPVREEERSPRVWGLASDESAAVSTRLADRSSAARSPLLRAVLAARALAASELYDGARRELLRALALGDAPALRVTLGDLYMKTALPEWAAESYRRAAETATDPAVLGAALFGAGRAQLALKRFDAARESFQRAVEPLGRAGLERERAAAVEGAARARERSISN